MLVDQRVFRQIGIGQFKEGSRRSGAPLLQVNERARQLNETLKEVAIGAASIDQPEFLQHVVGLIEQLPVETLEVPQVMGVSDMSMAAADQARYGWAFFTH